MKKRILSVALCLCLALAMVPTAVLAEEYQGWDSSITYAAGDVILIDSVEYTYDSDKTNKDLNLADNTPTINTIYKAGNGYALFTPEVKGADPLPATLTFNNATMNLEAFSQGVTLPAGVKVVFEGVNSIVSANYYTAYIFYCQGGAAFALEPNSDTTLMTVGEVSDTASAIYSLGSVDIAGSGKLTLKHEEPLPRFSPINAKGDVNLTGGTLRFTGKVFGDTVTLGAVTIPFFSGLNLSGAATVEKGTTGAENNDAITLPVGTTGDDVAALALTGRGYVKVEKDEKNIQYYNHDGTSLICRNNELNFTLGEENGGYWSSSATLEKDGYSIKGDATNGYVLSLGNLLFLYTDAANPTINLPRDGKVEVKLVGNTRLITDGIAMAFLPDVNNPEEYPCTISGSGALTMLGFSREAIYAAQPLTISGGDIMAFTKLHAGFFVKELTVSGGTLDSTGTSNGINSDGTVTFSGGTVNAAATDKNGVALRAKNGITLLNTCIARPNGAVTGTVNEENYYTVVDKDGKPVTDLGILSLYTLTFATNGGSAIADVTKADGTAIDLSASVPTRGNYAFAGWYRDKALTEEVTSLELTENMTVYAKWTLPVAHFSDVSKNAWYSDDVAFVYAEELMQGTEEATFAPQDMATRGMFVTTLYRLEGEPAITGECPFDDVEADEYYENAIIWAAENGVINGYEKGKFCPDKFITREQMAVMMYRYASFKDYDVTAQADLSKFSDEDSVSSYAKTALAWANATELINGEGNDVLNPLGQAKRCEVAAVLHRFCVNIIK